MNIAHLLNQRMAKDENAVAIIDNSGGKSRRFTFAQIDLASSRIAMQFFAAGLHPGDAIVLMHPVSAELYIFFIAILRSGLVAMFIDPSAGREHLEQCCAIHPPRAFLGSARAHLLRLRSPALRRISLKFSTDLRVFGSRRLDYRQPTPTRNRIEDRSAESPAIIRFTSGSTGKPKATMRSHGFLLAQQRVLEKSFTLTAGELDLVTMPMFVLSNLAAGVTSLIPAGDLKKPGSIPPPSVLRQIQQHQPDRIGASPAFLENLADYCADHSLTIDCLKKIFTGGAPVFPRLLAKLGSVAPSADILSVYGSTEAEPIAVLNHRDISPSDRERMATGSGLLAGFPDDAIRVRILQENSSLDGGRLTAEEFQAAQSPTGQPGQVVVAGPHVQPNYLNDLAVPKTQLEVAGSLWHRTGDAGYLDERGRLWLLGRCCARINDRHGTIYPFQAECVAREDPKVRFAALLTHENHRVLALESMSGSEIATAEMKSKLKWACIEKVLVLSFIPVDKRHNAKVDYPALQSLLSDRKRTIIRPRSILPRLIRE